MTQKAQVQHAGGDPQHPGSFPTDLKASMATVGGTIYHSCRGCFCAWQGVGHPKTRVTS